MPIDWNLFLFSSLIISKPGILNGISQLSLSGVRDKSEMLSMLRNYRCSMQGQIQNIFRGGGGRNKSQKMLNLQFYASRTIEVLTYRYA